MTPEQFILDQAKRDSERVVIEMNDKFYKSAEIKKNLATTKIAGDEVSMWIGFVAVIFAMINVVGGFLVTDRMLKMFKRK